MIHSPCHNCPDRIRPTKENPQTCHGNCEKEAEYLRIVHGFREKKEKEREINEAVMQVRTSKVHEAAKRKYRKKR